MIADNTVANSDDLGEPIDIAKQALKELQSISEQLNAMIKEFCALDEKSEQLLEKAFRKLNLSARATTRILKVARTVADIEGAQNILPQHISEAIQYISFDRKYND